MGSDGGRDYSPTEIFAIKFVLADVIIIAALVLAGPWVAVAITGLFVLSFLLLWYLIQAEPFADDEPMGEREVASEDAGVDPVTKLQQRYAAGELSDAEFEAKLERLIEGNERAESAGIDTEELELELEFERSGPE
ncbi:hypothetical protein CHINAEXTREME_13640 [Halobiforma lacisalsi AJ5]|uniref:SHOCT domain-containing protein n=1 Tax=Natronobacterium lacisalsi AJ5 TaxID=358396 RepID=M0LF87_NATLA|nr:SHOCT domain-containing protein [Halobiforma lacisalsi]APW98762.1 hypothetical protein CHINAEXTREME_13640 [Halobiforma lacisalsi AJ5]EMA32252.1 hypothetical protein C445_10982 [Halobiforma lacisalsi AJ5]